MSNEIIKPEENTLEEIPTEVKETPVEKAPKEKSSEKQSETKALFSTWEKAVQEELISCKPLIDRGANIEVVIHIGRYTPTAKEIHVPSMAVSVREMK